ncbi:hypothetical protein Ani05nite_56780 [Amorphoplanes nipponensis]|uniref:Uncharacterized protein n=1 Tax=Actinoplanes nipponensis TaxID=135950 RepID=A0A919MJT2_9ACTN|nr:hypothetical protein Ani05nite_56780 [Actinoplanes nipponensis]
MRVVRWGAVRFAWGLLVGLRDLVEWGGPGRFQGLVATPAFLQLGVGCGEEVVCVGAGTDRVGPGGG